MTPLNHLEAFGELRDHVLAGIREHFPVKGLNRTLTLDDLVVKDVELHADDIRGQLKARLEGKTWAAPVYATMSMFDNATGKVIDKKKVRVADIPMMTRRFSYIVDGNEYQVDNQWQLKPGVYTKRTQSGELETRFNVTGKGSFNVLFDPKEKAFVMKRGDNKASIPLYPLLKTLGVDDDALERAWGKDVLAANKQVRGVSTSLEKFFKTDRRVAPASAKAAEDYFLETMKGSELRPEATALTLDKAFTHVEGDTLVRSTGKMLDIHQGTRPEDDRDSLVFKELRGAADYAYDRLANFGVKRVIRQKLLRQLNRGVGKTGRPAAVQDMVRFDTFNAPLRDLFTKSSLSRIAAQVNPVEMMAGAMQTTIMGEGGIKSRNRVVEDAKLINPSHFGFVDSLHTPESESTGITLHLPVGVQKEGREPKIPVYNLKTKQNELLGPKAFLDAQVVLPDQVAWKNGIPEPISTRVKLMTKGNDVIDAPFVEADYALKHPSQIFSITSNLIPFMGNTSGNRASYATHHIDQAISLVHREAPLVQVGTGNNKPGLKSFEELMGRLTGHASPITGKVTEVKRNAIFVTAADGEKHEVQLYRNFPLNDPKALLHSTPLVAVGDSVKEGQPLADTNFSKKGVLALGTNLRVAFVPYKGYNYEDSVVISETAASKLSSMHLHKPTIKLEDDTVTDPKKFARQHLTAFKREQYDLLDETGVIRTGVTVQPGDPLALASKPFLLKDRTSSAAVRKNMSGAHTDASLRWDSDYPGKITGVHRDRKGEVTIHVKTIEPMQVGDKLCFDEQTEVLTSTGWVPVAHVSLQHEVCTLVGEQVVYQCPLQLHAYPTGGRMYAIKSQQVDLLVTENHSMYVKRRGQQEFELLPAKGLFGKRIHYKKDGEWLGKDPAYITFDALEVKAGQYGRGVRQMPEMHWPVPLFVAVLGAYLSNGCCISNNGTYGINISKRRGQLEPLLAVLDSYGIAYSTKQSKTSDCDGVNIYSKQLQQYFQQFGRASNKFIPPEVFSYSKESLGILMKWLIWGDGTSIGTRPVAYFTSSERLADDVQRLALHVGMAGNKAIRSEAGWQTIKGKQHWCQTAYEVRLVTTKLEPQVNHGHVHRQKIQREEFIEAYNRPVYCVTVPGHVLYVRRNGKSCWSGNSGLNGNKGIVGLILPDDKMPHTRDKKPLEVLLNPSGIPGRVNPGQVLALAAGKIAEKIGKPYVIENFSKTHDMVERLQSELKTHGLSDTEEIIDPISGVHLGKALVGPMHMLKLTHQIDKKTSVRSGMTISGQPAEAYDVNLMPSRGGKTGGQSIGNLGMYSLLAHGALHNIREIQTWKSEGPDPSPEAKRWPSQHQEVWRAIQMGDPLPTPRPTFAFQKFTDLLRAAGVNVEKRGHDLHLLPLTSKQVLAMSHGELSKPKLRVQAKFDVEGDPVPEKGGLFDPKITGGINGKCFHPSTQIWTEHGMMDIGSIVNNRLQLRVWSYDFDEATFVLKPIIGWFKNKSEEGIGSACFNDAGTAFGPEHNAFQTLWGTRTHQVFDEKGVKRNLVDADYLMMVDEQLSESQIPTSHLVKTAFTYRWKTGMRWENTKTVYDIGVAETHNYVANGILVSNSWSHFPLAEPMPNPVFSGAIQHVLGITGKVFTGLVESTAAIDRKTGKSVAVGSAGSITGGGAVAHLLGQVDVGSELKKTEKALSELVVGKAIAHGGNTAKLDKLHKKAKFLRALDAAGLTARDAYVLEHVAVIPPAMRTVTVMNDRALKEADLNHLYSSLAQVNEGLAHPNQQYLGDADKAQARTGLYDGLKALMITGTVGADKEKTNRGILQQIAGTSPKAGYFQSTLLSRRQDLSMRSTIVPEPAMGLDEVGLPTEKALNLFRPFVVRKLVEMGAASTPLMAQDILGKKDSQLNKHVLKALDDAMVDRPVLLKRDPSLHKHSVMAFQARRMPGKAIQVHPLVTGGFNADFDGDSVIGEVIIATPADSGYNGSKESIPMPHVGNVISYQVVDLKEFPRLVETAVTKDSGVTEYDVPLHVYVPSYVNGVMKLLPVTKYSIHHNCEEWEVKTQNGRDVICSSDHSLALLDPETLEVVKTPPRDAVGRCAPVMRSLTEPQLFAHFEGAVPLNNRAQPMMPNVPMTIESGWFIGASIGDGWVSDSSKRLKEKFTGKYKAESQAQTCSVNLAHGAGGEEVAQYWAAMARCLSTNDGIYSVEKPHTFDGFDCNSTRSTSSSTALGLWLEPLIGSKAANKHLPPYFLEMPEAFRRGLFCGLIDTDGTSNWNTRGQYSLAYNTSSKRLAEEVQLLGLSLGLHSGLTETTTPRGKPFYVIPFSIRPVQQATWLHLVCPHKRAALTELQQGVAIDTGRNDFVPMTDRVRTELLDHLRDIGAARKRPNQNQVAFASYVVLSRKQPTITRESVVKIAGTLAGTTFSEYLMKWFALALNTTIGWDLVETAKATGNHIEMYDMTVPNAWTFTMANGLVVWDTMSVYVPLSNEAVAEARKMFPSNNLFNEATGHVIHAPTLDSALGLYKLSLWNERHGNAKTIASAAELVHSVASRHHGITDVVDVAGIGHTTAARLLLSTALPESMHHKVLTDSSFLLDKKGLPALYTDLAKNHRSSYGDVANRLKDFGFGASFGAIQIPHPFEQTMGAVNSAEDPKKHLKYLPINTHTLSLEDFAVDKRQRDKVLAPFHARVKLIEQGTISQVHKDQRVIEEWKKATKELQQVHVENAIKHPSNLFQMYQAGIKPGATQYHQLQTAPMLYEDSQGRTLPIPVLRTFSEGLDLASYWTQMHGARRGSVQKVQEVQEPGFFSKQLMNTTIGLQVNGHDCGTTRGISLPVSSDDVYDRELAADARIKDHVYPRGTILKADLVSHIRGADKAANLVVRSPLKCEHDKGLCQKDAGINVEGVYHPLGTNLGVLAAQALGERAVQLTLKAFHQGGSAGAGGRTLGAFARTQQLTLLPETIPDAASLAMRSGTITKIDHDKTGSWVHIDDVPHFVPLDRAGRRLTESVPGLKSLVEYSWTVPKVGQKIKAGSLLSDPNRSFVNMHDLYRATDSIEEVQNHLVNELHSIYKHEGVRRPHIETVVKAMTNLTRIREPGDSGVLKGDYMPYSVVEARNRELKAAGKDPIIHVPIVKGINVIPHLVQEDWLAKLNFERLKGTIMNAAATGATSALHGVNPVAGIAYGAEFGLTEKNKHLLPHLKDVSRHSY